MAWNQHRYARCTANAPSPFPSYHSEAKRGREGEIHLPHAPIIKKPALSFLRRSFFYFLFFKAVVCESEHSVYAPSHFTTLLFFFGTTPLAEIQSACVLCYVCVYVFCIIGYMHLACAALPPPPPFFFKHYSVFFSRLGGERGRQRVREIGSVNRMNGMELVFTDLLGMNAW